MIILMSIIQGFGQTSSDRVPLLYSYFGASALLLMKPFTTRAAVESFALDLAFLRASALPTVAGVSVVDLADAENPDTQSGLTN